MIEGIKTINERRSNDGIFEESLINELDWKGRKKMDDAQQIV